VVLTSSLFLSFVSVNWTFSAESIDGHQYSTPFILFVSLWLSQLVIWSNWSVNPNTITSTWTM